MPNQPPNFHESLNQLLVPTATMVEAAQHVASGMEDAQAADAVGVEEEVVLVWHRLHLGFQERIDLLETFAFNRNLDLLDVRNALLLELDIEELERAAASLSSVAGRKMSYCPPPKRRPQPASARDRLTKLVETEYERQVRINRDLDFMEREMPGYRKPDRERIEVEIVEHRLAAIELAEEGLS